MKFKRGLLVCIMGALLLASGCGSKEEPPQPSGSNSPSAETKGSVHIVYVEWVCAAASSHVVADVLKNKMGYEVELTPVSGALMFESLAQGDADFCTTAWLPVTHAAYMDKIGDKVEDVAVNCSGAKIGLAVPAYVDINSIEELNSIKDSLGGEIIGIDPGAGIMSITQQAINDYGLDLILMEGSDATMTAALKTAVDQNKPVVVTAWRPHWKFSRWDLKFLDDPKNVYGADEDIRTVARLGLNQDMPEVYEFLKNFNWSIDQLNEVILMADESGDNAKAAAEWIANNPEIVNSWLPEAYKTK